MEQEMMQAPYDYRAYDRIWKRVDPTLDPYPQARLLNEGAAAEPSAPTGEDGLGEELRALLREELTARHGDLLAERAMTSSAARQTFRAFAQSARQRIRRLLAALYLLTGERGEATLCFAPERPEEPHAALRRRYREEICLAAHYRRAAQSAADPCIYRMLQEFSEQAYRRAEALVELLAGK